jgi:4a-hydroxytetrahydrobiopterin dehydratase
MESDDLAAERCVACRPDSPRLTAGEMADLGTRLPDWSVVEREGVPRLERSFRFPDFRAALDFTQRVGELAEAEGHHPTLVTSWGRVKVTWWTHAIRGLHRNDAVMAAKTDGLYGDVRRET